MNIFDENFLLSCERSRELYHGFAAKQPIIDYHCHLNPLEIASDKRWQNLSDIWLGGDHYKWRAMRTAGVSEKYCTGNATPWEKFEKYAETMPKLLRNPLYHWSHLELKQYFGIQDRYLNSKTAKSIYDEANEIIQSPDFSARSIMKKSHVRLVCTTDDPTDDLKSHVKIAQDPHFNIDVLPTWRPDRAWEVHRPQRWNEWILLLEKAADTTILSFSNFLEALQKRHDLFHSHGCRLSDRGIETLYCDELTENQAARIFENAREGRAATPAEYRGFHSFLLHELALMDAEKGWTQQLHLGALRSVNTRMALKLGADSGFDSIGDWSMAEGLAHYLDRLDQKGKLSKTILYNLNPRDNELIATMVGNFQDGEIAGKIQFGSGWWFLDQLEGMKRQIESLSQLGLLSQFVGMLTDSRSFLSYPRHDYFRRLLCDLLGKEMEAGLLPDDLDHLGNMIKGICYSNAMNYFQF
ncbi:MAG: glucuronate isomerase [Verrucomicrobiota bacterium]